MTEQAWFAAGAVCAMVYMVMGIGVARKQKVWSLFTVFFWPVALGVIAQYGRTRFDD